MTPKRRSSDYDENTSAQTTRFDQYVTFAVAEQRYGLNILEVREIRIWSGVTALPNAPEHVRGVINLRGAIIPVIDMRALFGLGQTVPTSTHVVVIVAAHDGLTGLLVDSVSDIVSIESGTLAALPARGSDTQRLFAGLIEAENELVAVLDLNDATALRAASRALELEPRHVA